MNTGIKQTWTIIITVLEQKDMSFAKWYENLSLEKTLKI